MNTMAQSLALIRLRLGEDNKSVGYMAYRRNLIKQIHGIALLDKGFQRFMNKTFKPWVNLK